MKRKIMLLMLTVVMLIPILVACKGEQEYQDITTLPAEIDETTPPAETDGTTGGEVTDSNLLVIEWHAGNWGWAEPVPELDIVRAEINRLTGLDILVTTIRVGSYDELIERLQTWAAAGMQGWPNIVWVGADDVTIDLYNRLGREGLLVDWMPYLEARPALLETYRILFPRIITADGKLYGLPAQYSDIRITPAPNGVYIRNDWINQLGAKWPTNLDEFEALLRRFAAEIPDVDGKPIIPLMMFGDDVSGSPTSGIEMFNFFYPNNMQTATGGMRWWFDESKQEAINIDIEFPQYLTAALEFYSKLYSDGIIPRDAFVLSQGQIDEMASTGRIGAMWGTDWVQGPYNFAMAETNPDAMFVLSPRMYKPGVNTEPALVLEAATPYTLWAMRTDAPEGMIDGFLEFAMWSSSPEGTFVINYGVEGVHWVFDENGKIVDTPDTAERLQGDWSLRVEEGIGWYGIQFDYEAWAEVREDLDINSPSLTEFMRLGYQNQGFITAQGYNRNAAYYVSAGEIEMTKGMGYVDRWREMVIRAITGDPANVAGIVQEWVQTEMALGYEEIKAERTASARALDMSFLP